ncbi:MAG: DNA mismatch repair endonuclease MutL [Desulfomonile tiedjei]|nr:DNA mismatch repair endonuclease MutL [Desulfomonile tiedjei]
MANNIRVLDEHVINRIAAGEVVERPVSVVKELVENSIDAGSASIRVDIENGGKKLIRVRDNGAGMSHDDAFLSLERHATSKLRSEKDLVGVSTMGFRGEALASIASVSKLRLVTQDASEPAGTEILIEGGVLRKSDHVAMGRGTLIEVRNLFFNVPVRRKFLKAPGLETAYIQELMTKLALAFPSIGFVYSEDGRVKLDAPAVKSTFERIHSLYSKDVRENLLEIDYSLDEARLRGYVARPPYARSNMRSVLTFVNGRSVKDRLVNSAVNRAFANLIERGRFPLAILFIEVPPDQVDVNVHPQKAEVRFVKPGLMSQLILDGIHQTLMGSPFHVAQPQRESIFPRPPTTSLSKHLQDERLPEEPLQEHVPAAPSATSSVEAPAQSPQEHPGRFASLGILGKLPGSFVVLFGDEDLVIMDHHAAHERLLFDELTRSEKSGNRFQSQGLLIPRIIEFSAVEARALAAHLRVLQDAGFEIEEFGERDFVVKGVPGWIDDSKLETFFNELIGVMLDTGLRGDTERLKQEIFKKMACSAAIKETKGMQPEEIRSLLKDLDRTGAPETCPHGRPLTVRFPLEEIRKKMGRK